MNYLEEAKKFAKQMRSPYIGTEHLMYVFLENDEQLCLLLNVAYEEYKEKLIERVGIPEVNKKGYAKEQTPKLKEILRDLKTMKLELNALNFTELVYDDGDGVAYRLLVLLDAEFETYLERMHENDLPAELFSEDCLINLNEKVSKHNIHVFGMKKKSDELINNLFKVRKPNVIITGKAGCGKSALVEHLAERINKGDVPDFMKDKVIIEMVVSDSVAGTRYRGDFEERIKRILRTIQKCPRIILFIDEFHIVMGAGGAEGAVALANILKPYLARGEISLIGATTIEEYEIIKKDKAMQRRFTLMQLLPPNEEELMAILKGWAPQLEKHYHVVIEDDLLRSIIRKCRKIKTNSSPDKELDELEKWCLENCNWRAVNWELISQ